MNSVRPQRRPFARLLFLALVPALFGGCISTGSRQMETVVTDMHQRVTTLDRDLEASIVELNEKAAALIARVNENERQVRLLHSMMEENQHKIDTLLRMLYDLKVALYRHWGLDPGPPMETSPRASGVRIEPPTRPVTFDGGAGDVAVEAPAGAAAPAIGDDVAYAAAKQLYDDEAYGDALSAFSSFLRDFPVSEHRHKAEFWRGKCHLNQSEYTEAIQAFETLRRDHPDSSYMAFALHNQAVAHFRRGEKETAVALMEAVVANYPSSTAADHARRDLRQLQAR